MFDVEYHIFITMATRASLWQISVTPLYCPPSKTHSLVQDSALDLFYKSSYSQFSANIPKISILYWYHNASHCYASASYDLHTLIIVDKQEQKSDISTS